MCVTIPGYLVHPSSTTVKTAWDYCTQELYIEQFVKVYTRNFFNKLSLYKTTQHRLLDYLITRIGDISQEPIIRVSVTGNLDLIIGYQRTEAVKAMIANIVVPINTHHTQLVYAP